ncbi:MAG: deoxyribose-phosphate aldolase [Erysipelotrichaceae bacterium]|nr:deoxyribose-phosphate aldolase [Erysipelotrichaceae bacterium]
MKASKYIDHTQLKPDATKDKIVTLCREAREYDFASVCINPCWIPLAKELLEGSDVKVCTVIGFPLGAMSTAAKCLETATAVQDGAEEVDMVINIGKLKDGEDDYVRNEIKAIKEACSGRLLKVIIETCLLTDEEKVRACKLAKEAGADFVKTSTGFSTGGATVEDVALMRRTVGEDMGVKAAGGVRDKETFEAMIKAGATRIGTSSGKNLI